MSYPTLDFQVPSHSTGEVYQIELSRSGDNLTMTCTCAAGSKKTHCKHRLMILQCDFSDVDSGDTDQANTILQMLEGSDVEAAWAEVIRLEEEQKQLKNKLSAAKKQLGRALDD